MSFAIDEQDVTGVLLTDGNWYECEPKSFCTDAFELGYYYNDSHHHPGWTEDRVMVEYKLYYNDGIGISFKDGAGGQYVYAPMASVVALRTAVVSADTAEARLRKKKKGGP